MDVGEGRAEDESKPLYMLSQSIAELHPQPWFFIRRNPAVWSRLKSSCLTLLSVLGLQEHATEFGIHYSVNLYTPDD